MKTFGIYSHHIAMFIIATILYAISLVFIYLVTGNLYLLTAFTQFLLPACHPLTSDNHKFDLFYDKFICF